ncbi:ORF6N domain-containing protein [Clostridium sp. DSM 100503]|nr:ORF6N domain-containing protein [Clostridium sp. DSM 100503]
MKINNNDLSVKEFSGQRVVTFKDIDMLHERVEGTAGRNFRDNKKHFVENEDYFLINGNELKDFKQTTNFVGSNAKELTLITESGYLMLVKSLQDDLAWKVQRELVNNYFRVKENVQALNTSELSPELQMFNQIFRSLANNELEQKRLNAEIKEVKEETKEVKEEIQGIRDVVAINTSTVSWREECRKLIVKMAHSLGGNKFIGDVNREVYDLMRTRLKCKLDVQLTNMRRRMADEGVCKSKRDKLNYLDVINRDSRLIEGYVAIVKELDIKYGA